MKIFERIRAGIKSFRFFGTGAGATVGSFFTGLLPGAKFNYLKQAGKIYDNSVVSAGLNWYAKQIEEPRIIVERLVEGKGRGKWEEIKHDFPTVFDSGNPWHDGGTLLFGLTLSVLTNGNGYLFKIRSNIGKVLYYAYAPHWIVEAKSDNDNVDGTKLITHYQLNVISGSPIRFEPRDVVHIRWGVDPEDTRLGLSPIGSVLREICTENEAATLTAALLRNGGLTALILSPKGEATEDLTPEQRAEAKSKWRQHTTGEFAGTPLMVPFAIDVESVGYSPDKLVLDKLRSINVSRICAALNLDPLVLHLPSVSKTYDNYKQALESATENSLLPFMRRIAKQLTRQCLADFGDATNLRVGWDISEMRSLQEDQDKLHERTRENYKAGVLKRSEARAAIGFEAGEDDDVYLTDFANVPMTGEKAKAKKEILDASKRNRQKWEDDQLADD